MFEEKSGDHYSAYNNVNENIYEWKKYRHSTPSLNQHNMMELEIDLGDAALKGTENTLELGKEVINTY